ncbi:MAG TPA: M14 family zinc carboxypeptidase, partial [bacterium]
MKRLFIIFALLPILLFAQVQLPLSLQTPPVGTSHADMMQFLTAITGDSKLIGMEVPGRTLLDREIPVIYFPKRSQWKKENTTVMIFAQQHGNEPSGKEALLMLLHELHLSPKSNPYSRLNLILVPMSNPDGNEAHQRKNNNRVDLNRNHV